MKDKVNFSEFLGSCVIQKTNIKIFKEDDMTEFNIEIKVGKFEKESSKTG